ncbi:MAG: signal peptidase II [Rickettsiales bacterium]
MNRRNFIMGTGLSAIIIAADQLVKHWLVVLMQSHPHEALAITPFFNLVMVWNRGISFGMFAGDDARHILIGMTSVIVVALCLWLWRATEKHIWVPLGLIIGGATGNVIDRVRWGAVADFFDFHLAERHWPAFNVADSAIVVGVILLLWMSFFSKKPSA